MIRITWSLHASELLSAFSHLQRGFYPVSTRPVNFLLSSFCPTTICFTAELKYANTNWLRQLLSLSDFTSERRMTCCLPGAFQRMNVVVCLTGSQASHQQQTNKQKKGGGRGRQNVFLFSSKTNDDQPGANKKQNKKHLFPYAAV